MLKEIKEDCKYLLQHYTLNNKSKRLCKISCGHCTKTRRGSCVDCPHYEEHDISEEIISLSVYRMFHQFTQELKRYKKQLAEELEPYKQKKY